MLRHLIAAAIGYNANRAVRHIPEQGCVRLFHVEDHRSIVRRIDTVHEAVYRCLRAAYLALQQGIKRPLHIARSQRPPIVKFSAAMKMKDVGQGIGNLPAFG